MPMQSVSFIAKFEHFADPMVPYMYHCHLLHHEDEGMMGSFLVVDPTNVEEESGWVLAAYPNPADDFFQVVMKQKPEDNANMFLTDAAGRIVETPIEWIDTTLRIKTEQLNAGIYAVILDGKKLTQFVKK